VVTEVTSMMDISEQTLYLAETFGGLTPQRWGSSDSWRKRMLSCAAWWRIFPWKRRSSRRFRKKRYSLLNGGRRLSFFCALGTKSSLGGQPRCVSLAPLATIRSPRAKQGPLRQRIKEIASIRVRYDYRCIHSLHQLESWRGNHKNFYLLS
jgi:hypothetical protein